VWAWGDNEFGNLGIGNTTNHSTPVKVNTLTNVVAIAGGRDHTLAVESNGTVWVWGWNQYGQQASFWTWGQNNDGQLGDGTKTNRSAPIKVPGLTGAFGLGGGVNCSVVLHS
jgi:alpha-tubulin suppressor-like RCC1 family protein